MKERAAKLSELEAGRKRGAPVKPAVAPPAPSQFAAVMDVESGGLGRTQGARMRRGLGDSLSNLPKLPTPDYKAMRSQNACGNVFVLSLIAFYTSQVYLCGEEGKDIYAALIYSEAVIAIICLLGLALGDPGVVKRSRETCFPLPNAISEALLAGKDLSSIRSNVRGDDGRTFCVRCFVWRPDNAGEVHHCSICQRCVTHFDHHCGVFGRCICGRGFGGNMGYFKVLISMFFCAFCTWVAFLLFLMETAIFDHADPPV